jgi:hypothetical protein
MSDPCTTCGQRRVDAPRDCCVNCGTELSALFRDHDPMSRQYDNALELTQSGGYGMFFDNIDGDHHVFLCHDCAHNLCDATPWLARLIQPERSHMHERGLT